MFVKSIRSGNGTTLIVFQIDILWIQYIYIMEQYSVIIMLQYEMRLSLSV